MAALKKVSYHLTPNHQVGPFVLGEPVIGYIQQYNLTLVPDEYEPKVDWIVYEVNVDDRIYVEDGNIVAVTCCSSCIYNKKELIGQPIDDILKGLNDQLVSIDQLETAEGPQKVYDFEALGLELWAQDGIVVTAIVSDSES